MELTIITPYYKTLEETKKLAKTLESQLNDKVEWIIIDDGCNEKELDNIKAKVIHLDRPSGTASKPRNIGLDNAKGKYIAFIDSDDNVKDNYIETILKAIKTNKDYYIMSWEAVGYLQRQVIINDMPPTWNTCVWNTVYKKELIGDTRFNESKLIAEDEEFNNKVRQGTKDNICDIMYIYTSGRKDSLTQLYSGHKDTIRCSLLVYQKFVSKIGGIETFLYNFFKALYKDYDITFVYDEADIKQLIRYSKYVKCIKNQDQHFICDKYICASNQKNIADRVNSLENFYAMMIHADYDAMNWYYQDHNKTTLNIAVSELAKKGVEKQSKKPTIVIYNLLELLEPKPIINIISATRLSWEKGEDKIYQFAERLQQRGILYNWQIFTDNLEGHIPKYGLSFRESSLEVGHYIANSDFYFDSSETESYGYSDVEALSYGVPLIAIDKPIFKEIGINDTNAYILKKDMSNMDELIDNILKDKKVFKYNKLDNKKQWIDLLGKDMPKGKYEWSENMKYEVRALFDFDDATEKDKDGNMIHREQKGNSWIIDEERKNYLLSKNAIEIINIIPEEKKKTTKRK